MLTVSEWPGIGTVVWNGGRIKECPAEPPRRPAKAVLTAGEWYESPKGEKRFLRGITPEGNAVYRGWGKVRSLECSIDEFNAWRNGS